MKAAWRVRITREALTKKSIIRCFDVRDFNSQHSALTLFLLTVHWLKSINDGERLSDYLLAEFMDLMSKVSISTVEASAIWQDGENSHMASTLGSGVRLTTKSNTWSSISYDGPIVTKGVVGLLG